MTVSTTQSITGKGTSGSSGTGHSPQYYLDAGTRFLKNKRFPEAVAAFKHISYPYPSDPHILYLFAQAYHGNGQWEDAVQSLIHALHLKPSFPEAHYLLGSIRQETMILEKSIIIHRKAVAEHPEDAKGYYFLGMDLIQRGLLQEATECFKKTIELRPDYPDPYHQLGVIYSQGDKTDWAIKEFDKAMQLRPGYIDSGLQIVHIHFQKNQFDEAAKRLQQMLEFQPKHPDLNFYMGECYRRQGNWMNAISAYQSAILGREQYQEAWSNVALSYMHTNQWEEARLSAQKGLQMDEKDTQCLFVLGTCALQKNMGTNAHTYFRRYLQLVPNGSDANKIRFYLNELDKGVIPKVI